MNHPHNKSHLFDKPGNVRRLIQGLALFCALLLGLDVVLPRHAVHPWEGLFGFYAFYGFAACVLLVVLAKGLRKLLMRSRHYYQQQPEPQSPNRDQDEDNRGSHE